MIQLTESMEVCKRQDNIDAIYAKFSNIPWIKMTMTFEK